ncbi:MAG: aldehyde dehydrogenase family protein [Actinobacteria bacterium]|nr:aldehyde dehydrogenase family protein [Actinomycetota bacterium]
MSEPAFRVTYATLSADNDDLHTAYDQGIAAARDLLGHDHPFYVAGQPGHGEGTREVHSPIDRDILIGRFAQAAPGDVDRAVASAAAFAPTWAATPWPERVGILRRGADLISERRNVLAAAMAFEVGKNRLEALGDVEESADLIRYYCHQMEEHEGFTLPMGRLSDTEVTSDVMRPHGVWAVISPFNFPMALAAGPAGAALVAGNTVVCKPATNGSLTGIHLYQALRDGGLPPEAFHLITGSGSVAGSALTSHPDVAGITFTGSYEVGMAIYRTFSTAFPKPAICEMGGKNPTIITARADLDKASDGVLRSAFGYGGQKCSANSRVYVAPPVADEFIERLLDKTSRIRTGNPLERDVYLGPLIDERSIAVYQEAVAEAAAAGEVLIGGARLTDGDLARGNYVAPTVVRVPRTSWIWKRELFVPLIAVDEVDDLDEALTLANDTEYGLTAGFYSEDPAEIDRFLAGIQAGVVYVNRRAGATTGAWPGVQPFGGWKGSGTAGKSGGGPYYLTQYLREQSRTRVEE